MKYVVMEAGLAIQQADREAGQWRGRVGYGDLYVLPLVVDLEGALLRSNMLFELLVSALSVAPAQTVLAVKELSKGPYLFSRRLSEIAELDVETVPVREDFALFLRQESAAGREIYLISAEDQSIVEKISKRFAFFRTLDCQTRARGVTTATEKPAFLAKRFPDGFVYAGCGTDDVFRSDAAKGAVIISNDHSICEALRADGKIIEGIFSQQTSQGLAWLQAIRPHQWAKNLVVLVPLLLGWRDLTATGLLSTIGMLGLLCLVASLTYLVNDMVDLAADRAHWSKRNRPFASGAIPLRNGILLVLLALPLACATGIIMSPLAGACLVVYVVGTLGYSFGWKRIILFDSFVIGALFTIRIMIGIAAAQLPPSAWLLTFSMFFFVSLTLAKRHTEILRAEEHELKSLPGRGYRVGDQSLTLAFGSAASMASVLIVVIYLVEEVFARKIYTNPQWLWVAPIAIFLFSCRVWALSHRGRLADDPVAFALRDHVSLGLGVAVVGAILLAV